MKGKLIKHTIHVLGHHLKHGNQNRHKFLVRIHQSQSVAPHAAETMYCISCGIYSCLNVFFMIAGKSSPFRGGVVFDSVMPH